MRKYENVDIIASLGAVMELNTEHYKSDFPFCIAWANSISNSI